jgi:hypothetical protein
MSTRTLAVVAVLLFALTVAVRAPARWLFALAPQSLSCAAPAGSIWHGGCAQLRIAGAQLGELSWSLHFWPLLRGHLDADLRSDDARAPGSARVSLGAGGRLVLRDLRADLPIDSGLLPFFPNGWSGRVLLALVEVQFRAGRLAAVHGTASARALAQRSPPMPFGSYELNFGDAPAGAGVITAALRDLGGPLAVNGTLTIRNGSEYELTGLVATRPEVSDGLAKAVAFLGPADAQGRRPFSLAGSF